MTLSLVIFSDYSIIKAHIESQGSRKFAWSGNKTKSSKTIQLLFIKISFTGISSTHLLLFKPASSTFSFQTSDSTILSLIIISLHRYLCYHQLSAIDFFHESRWRIRLHIVFFVHFKSFEALLFTLLCHVG